MSSDKEPLKLCDLSPALAWRPAKVGMSGAEANAVIVAAYQALDKQFNSYLGAPPLSSWLTFAKYSARQVGTWIRGLEDAWSFLDKLKDRRSPVRETLRAGRALVKLLRSSPAQAALGAVCSIVRCAAARSPSPSERRGSTAVSWIRALAAAPRRLFDALIAVRRALVEGNTVLYGRVAFAFDLFMRSESRGESGLSALEAAVSAGRLDDSSGYLLKGFAKYRLARTLGLAVAAPDLSEGARTTLESLRRSLIFDANLMIAIQEQALVLQRPTIFGHPVVHEVLGAVRSGGLSLTFGAGEGSSGGQFCMLPDGGNWADFATRMGFRRVDSVVSGSDRAFFVVLPSDLVSGALYAPDWGRRGTVLDLFTRYFDGPGSELLRSGDPCEGEPAYG